MIHVHRYQDIVKTMIKHGFGYIVEEMGLRRKNLFASQSEDSGKSSTLAVRIRLMLEDLGPTFVKFGQILSTHPDLLPQEIILELKKLQDCVKTIDFIEIKQMVEQQLKQPLEKLFLSFDEEPLAAASIGQVHKACLHSGEVVAVKIQRPDIAETINKDIDILRELGRLAEEHFEWAVRYQLSDLVDEFDRAIHEELDYLIEARNTSKICSNLSDLPYIHIPTIYFEFTTKKILTMSYFSGDKLDQVIANQAFDHKLLAERIVYAFLKQVVKDGFFHADPHPGNLFFLNENEIAWIDFGQVGRLNENLRYHFASIIIALMRQSTDDVVEAFIDMSIVPSGIDFEQFHFDVEHLRLKYYDQSFSEISIGTALNELFITAQKYKIKIPKDFMLLSKSFMMIESIAEVLDPELSIIAIAEPFGNELILDGDRLTYRFKKYKKKVNDWRKLGFDFPKQVRQLLAEATNGELKVGIKVQEIDKLLQKLDRISNRISFSVTLLAFSIVMVGLMIGSTFGNESSILTKFPAVELSFVISFLMFIGLLWSIFKSGRF